MPLRHRLSRQPPHDRVGVGALHPEVVSPRGAGRPERVAVELVARSRRRSRARSSRRRSAFTELSGNTARTCSRSIVSTSPASSPADGCATVVRAGIDGADDLDAVARGEVAEGVVVGDELALRGRDAAHAARRSRGPPRARRSDVVALCAAPPAPRARGAARTSASPCAPPRASTLRGSCHQCGSSSPPGRRGCGRPAPRSTTVRVAAGVVGSLVDPVVEVAAAAEDHVGVARAPPRRRAAARSRAGRCSAAGSDAPSKPSPPICARPVADLRRGRDDRGRRSRRRSRRRRAPATSAGADRRRGRDPAPARPQRPDAPPRARTPRPRAPRSSRRAERSARPTATARRALDRDQRDGDRLPRRQAAGPQPHGRGRHDDQRRHEQRAERRQRGDDHERHQRQQHRVEQRARARRARLRRRGRTRVASQPARASGSPPARPRSPRPPARGRAARPAAGCRTAASRLPAPDSNTSLARITPSASMPARPSAVVASGPEALAAGERGDQRARTRPRRRARRAARRSRGRRRARGPGRRRCRPRGSRRRARAARSSSRARPRRPRAAAPRPARAGRRAARMGRAGRPRGEVYQIMGTVLITIAPIQRSMIGVVGTRSRKRSEWREHATAELRRAGHRSGGARSAVVDLMAAPALLPHGAGHLRPPARRRPRGRDRKRLPGARPARAHGPGAAHRPGLGLRLRARAPGRRPPSPRRVRPLRQGLLVRGPGARGGDRPARAAAEALGRRARRRAARRVPGLPAATEVASELANRIAAGWTAELPAAVARPGGDLRHVRARRRTARRAPRGMGVPAVRCRTRSR